MEIIHGDWQHLSAQEAADIEAEAGIASGAAKAGEEPQPQTQAKPATKGGATPRYNPTEARIADGRALIEAGEVLDAPTVAIPPDFGVTQVLRLRERTPEELEELRRRIGDLQRFNGDGYSYRDDTGQ